MSSASIGPARRLGRRAWLRAVTLAALASAGAWGQAGAPPAPVEYRIDASDAARHQLRIELTLRDLPSGPLALHVSRSSPGRYALHDFIRHVSAVDARTLDGQPLAIAGPDAHGWTVPRHPGAVRVSYAVRGDRVDGTYLGVDASHAHINMPAALVWAPGLEGRPARVTLVPPAGAAWTVATQLLPTRSPLTFTAPNFQYLMDSPVEFSTHVTRQFSVRAGGRTARFRLALHHEGRAAEADAFARDLEVITGEAAAVFGALPAFESPAYTFLADFRSGSRGDGMEHRNSSVLTAAASLATDRLSLNEKAAHEVFHAWNIERIRPRALEPFDFDAENITGELWLGEGVTNYYGRLLLVRAGLARMSDVLPAWAAAVDRVTTGPGRRERSLVEMSRLAPMMDGAPAATRAPYEAGFISYYTWGEAVGLALDLALRARGPQGASLDAVMQRLWEEFGAVPGEPGHVARPYEEADVERVIGEVAGDAAFARAFLDRYVRGREVPDFASLLQPAGYRLASRPGSDGQARLTIEPAEKGGTLTAAQRAFREAWIRPRRGRL